MRVKDAMHPQRMHESCDGLAMRVSADKLSRLGRVVRQIEAAGKPMVVYLDRHGVPDCFPALTGRHVAMAESREWAGRIKGVFMPGVTAAELAKAVFHA